MNENILTIKYNTRSGRGSMIINISEFFPCTIKDFKVLCGTISNSTNQGDIVNQLHNFFADIVETNKRYRSRLNPRYNDRDKKEAAKCNTLIKKYISLNNVLVDLFSAPAITDDDSTIKFKSVTVFATVRESGKEVIKEKSGWTFEKNNRTFEVFKDAKTGRYHVLYQGTGIPCATVNSRSEAPVAIDEELIKAIEKLEKRGDIEFLQKKVRTMAAAAGFIEEDPAADTSETSDNTSANQEPENNTSDTSDNDNTGTGEDTNQDDTSTGEDTNDNTSNTADNSTDNSSTDDDNTADNSTTNSNMIEEVKTMLDKNLFKGISTLAELRTKYKEFLKKFHPDNGGSTEDAQELNIQYAAAFEALKHGAPVEDEKEAVKWSMAEDEKIRAALYNIIHLDGLNIEIVGSWIWVDGDTYPVKDALKAAGFSWSKTRKKWHFAPYDTTGRRRGCGKSFDAIRAKYGSEKVESEKTEKIG